MIFNETAPTKQDVIDRLRPLFEKAARSGTGTSFLLTEEESAVFSLNDLENLKAETDCYLSMVPLVVYQSE